MAGVLFLRWTRLSPLRWFGLTRNPLRRGSDRVEGAVRAGAVLLAILSCVFAVPLGIAEAKVLRLRAIEELATRSQVSAVLLSASRDTGLASRLNGERSNVPVRWLDAVKRTHTGEVPVEAGARAGSRVMIWIDAEGRLTHAPLTLDAAKVGAGLIGLSTAFAGAMVAVVGSLLARACLDRRRYRQWERDWARFGRDWRRGRR